MTTFYIEPDPDEMDPLLLAHNAELKRRRAKPGNYGKYIGPGEIMSRTDKGDLSTIMRDGEAKHFWRAMAETRAARLGEELDKLPKAKARGSNQHAEKEERFQFGTAPTLDHLGIDKKLSSRSQRRDVL